MYLKNAPHTFGFGINHLRGYKSKEINKNLNENLLRPPQPGNLFMRFILTLRTFQKHQGIRDPFAPFSAHFFPRFKVAVVPL